jgi:hypothetical protein
MNIVLRLPMKIINFKNKAISKSKEWYLNNRITKNNKNKNNKYIKKDKA